MDIYLFIAKKFKSITFNHISKLLIQNFLITNRKNYAYSQNTKMNTSNLWMLNSQLSLMLEQNKKYAHCLKVCVYVAYGGAVVT